MFFNNDFINGLLASGKASAGVYNAASGLSVINVPEGKAIIIIGYKWYNFADLPANTTFANANQVNLHMFHQMRFIGSKGANTYLFKGDAEPITISQTQYYVPYGYVQADCFFVSETPIIIEISHGSQSRNWVVSQNQLPNEVPVNYQPPPAGYGKKGPAALNQVSKITEAGVFEVNPFNVYEPANPVPVSFNSFQWPINSNYALHPPQWSLNPFGNKTAPQVEVNFVVVNKEASAAFTNNITG